MYSLPVIEIFFFISTLDLAFSVSPKLMGLMIYFVLKCAITFKGA